MKKILLVTLLAITLSFNAIAQDFKSDVIKLLEASQASEMVTSTVDNMIPMLKQQLSSTYTTERELAILDKYLEYVMQETEIMSQQLIYGEMVNLYMQHYTHKEVKKLIKFYESDLGQKMIEVAPEMSSDIMTIMMEEYLPKLQIKFMNKLDELHAE